MDRGNKQDVEIVMKHMYTCCINILTKKQQQKYILKQRQAFSFKPRSVHYLGKNLNVFALREVKLGLRSSSNTKFSSETSFIKEF